MRTDTLTVARSEIQAFSDCGAARSDIHKQLRGELAVASEGPLRNRTCRKWRRVFTVRRGAVLGADSKRFSDRIGGPAPRPGTENGPLTKGDRRRRDCAATLCSGRLRTGRQRSIDSGRPLRGAPGLDRVCGKLRYPSPRLDVSSPPSNGRGTPHVFAPNSPVPRRSAPRAPDTSRPGSHLSRSSSPPWPWLAPALRGRRGADAGRSRHGGQLRHPGRQPGSPTPAPPRSPGTSGHSRPHPRAARPR